MSLLPKGSHMVIRLSLRGCTNRPFYHIVVMKNTQARDKKVTDQIGTYDPLPNAYNERLVALDFKKLRQWIGKGAKISTPVENLLGYAGYLPIHPKTRLQAFRIERKKQEQKTETQPGSDEQTTESTNS